MFPLDCTNYQISFLQSIFSTEKDVIRFPEPLCFDKVDAVFCFVALAFVRIELKWHGNFANVLAITKRSFVVELFDLAPPRRIRPLAVQGSGPAL